MHAHIYVCVCSDVCISAHKHKHMYTNHANQQSDASAGGSPSIIGTIQELLRYEC